VLPLAYDAAHQISGAQYGGLGQLLNDGLRTYTWDAASRLMAYSGADGAATSTYDGLGLRISRSSGGTTQNYVLNYALGLPSIATVQDGSNNDLRYYIHLPNGTLLYSIEATGNSRRFFHFDEVGSTTFLTNDSGTVTDSYGITPYGESVTPGANNATANPFTWLGAYGVMQEGATSLYYMRARWYDSSPARFLSRDPISSVAPQRINPYEYVEANPVSSVDPLGLQDGLPFSSTIYVPSTVNVPPNAFWSNDFFTVSPIRLPSPAADACQLGTSSTLIPTQLVMFISVTGSQQVSISNPQQTTAFIQPGLIVGGSNTGLQSVNNPNFFSSGSPFSGPGAVSPFNTAVYDVPNTDVNAVARANVPIGVSFISKPANNLLAPGQTLRTKPTHIPGFAFSRFAFPLSSTPRRLLGGIDLFPRPNGGGRSAAGKALAIQPPAPQGGPNKVLPGYMESIGQCGVYDLYAVSGSYGRVNVP
jgi:RHS repeat-associated protein